jgi:hypothetical protein
MMFKLILIIMNLKHKKATFKTKLMNNPFSKIIWKHKLKINQKINRLIMRVIMMINNRMLIKNRLLIKNRILIKKCNQISLMTQRMKFNQKL